MEVVATMVVLMVVKDAQEHECLRGPVTAQ